MTVGQKLHQCLAQLEGATASLKTFCLDTQDPTAQKLYAQLSDTLQHQIIDPLKSRVNYVESQKYSSKPCSKGRCLSHTSLSSMISRNPSNVCEVAGRCNQVA